MIDTADEEHRRIRPSTMTGGRVRSSTELALEAIVRVTNLGRSNASALAIEKRTICRLCETPTSVAEVAAHLRLRLGVARVLAGDLATEGLLDATGTVSCEGVRPTVELLERVLDGLQAI